MLVQGTTLIITHKPKLISTRGKIIDAVIISRKLWESSEELREVVSPCLASRNPAGRIIFLEDLFNIQ